MQSLRIWKTKILKNVQLQLIEIFSMVQRKKTILQRYESSKISWLDHLVYIFQKTYEKKH